MQNKSFSVCPICDNNRSPNEMQVGTSVPTVITDQIQHKHPKWQADMPVCDHCLRVAKADYASSMLAEENGEITELEQEVIDSFLDGDMMPTNENDEELRERTQSEIYADRLADVIGSWRFSLSILIFIIMWCSFSLISGLMQSNVMLMLGVISATLGSLAAIQGPIILMSQRRSAKRDRIRAENDFRVNLKAELEINALNHKLDHIIKLQLDNIRRIEELEADKTNIRSR